MNGRPHFMNVWLISNQWKNEGTCLLQSGTGSWGRVGLHVGCLQLCCWTSALISWKPTNGAKQTALRAPAAMGQAPAHAPSPGTGLSSRSSARLSSVMSAMRRTRQSVNTSPARGQAACRTFSHYGGGCERPPGG